jgi:hypothetical protein
MLMMVLKGSKERSSAAFEALLRQSSFKLTTTRFVDNHLAIVEAR